MFGLMTVKRHQEVVADYRQEAREDAAYRSDLRKRLVAAEAELATFRAARAKQLANLTQNRKAAKGVVS